MKWVTAGNDWTLVTSVVAMLQFNKPCIMFVGGDVAPTTDYGFTMTSSEKYVNNAVDKIWVRSSDALTGVVVTVCEVTA